MTIKTFEKYQWEVKMAMRCIIGPKCAISFLHFQHLKVSSQIAFDLFRDENRSDAFGSRLTSTITDLRIARALFWWFELRGFTEMKPLYFTMSEWKSIGGTMINNVWLLPLGNGKAQENALGVKSCIFNGGWGTRLLTIMSIFSLTPHISNFQ